MENENAVNNNNEVMITIPLKNLRLLETILMQFMVQKMKESSDYTEFEMSVETFNEWTKWMNEYQMRIFCTIEDDVLHCGLRSLLPEVEGIGDNVPE